MITLAELVRAIEPLEMQAVSPALMASPVAALTADSRRVVPGSLFVAICGAQVDGRAFIPEAVGKGCLAVVVEGEPVLVDATVPVIRVRDSHAALSDLAAAWYGFPAKAMRLIGLTGTNGKTTTSWLIEGMLAAAGHRPGVIGTVNYRFHGPDGVHVLQEAPLTTPDPLTLQGLFRTMADNGVTHVIMEVSSHALDQSRLGQTAFDVALFTNLSRDHLDYHLTMDDYFAAKKRLFLHRLKPDGTAVVVSGIRSEDRDWSEELVRSLSKTKLIRCGLDGSWTVRAEQLVQSVHGFNCLLDLDGQRALFSSPLTGRYNVQNVLAAASVGLALGLSAERIRDGLAAVARVPGRLERILLPGAAPASVPAAFVDYAHTPDALENVLRTLRELAPGRLICVFGCGGDRDRGKRPLMGAIAARYADVVLVTSDNPRTEAPEAIVREIAVGVEEGGMTLGSLSALFVEARNGYAVLVDRRAAIAAACSLAAPGDSILVAGKGHENYQILGTTKQFFDDGLEVTNGLLRWNQRSLLAATGGTVLAGRQQTVFAGISTDTRTLKPGDIFVALRGENFDGHQYIAQAVERGAAAVIAERFGQDATGGALCLQVSDSLRALGDLAAFRRRQLGSAVRVVAITGSSGKTTLKEMTGAIFAQAYAQMRTGTDPVLRTKGNFNNLIGLPLTLLGIEAGHRVAILEMGMNSPGEIGRLTEIADPDIGCINNVHPAHLLGLGSLEGVAAAKGELFAAMRPDGVRVVNCDDPQVVRQAKKTGGKHVGFAVSPSGRRMHPQVRATRIDNLGETGMRFTLHVDGWQGRLTAPVLGAHNVANCAAAAAIAHSAGIAPETMVSGLMRYRPYDKRLNVSVLPGGLKLVNDAYNANPASMAAGLRTVAALGGQCRHAAALGDMLELGEGAPALHRGIGELAAALGYDWLAITGAQAETVAQAARAAGMAPDRVRVFPDHQAMADWFCALLHAGSLEAGDWLLVKGSRGMRMERLIEAMTKRLHTES